MTGLVTRIRSTPPRWRALLVLILLLAIMTGVNAASLDRMPMPPLSSHRTWMLVPKIAAHLRGYDQRKTEDSDDVALSAAASFYPIPPRTPIPWTHPGRVLKELLPGGRLSQVVGSCPAVFATCMPHPYVAMAATSLLLPGYPVLVGLGGTIYLLGLLVGLYGIGCEMEGRRTGLVSVAIGMGYPALFGLARWPEGFLPAVALSVLMVLALIRSQGLTRMAPMAAFCLLAWSAMRTGEGLGEALGVGLAVSGPFMVELGRGIASSIRARRLPLRTLGLASMVGTFLLLTTDWLWVIRAMGHTTHAFTEFEVDAEPGFPASPMVHGLISRGIYLIFLYSDYLKPLLLGWLVLAAPLFLRSRARHRVSILLWFLVPLVVSSAIARKANWYGVVMVPPLAVITAAGLASLRPALANAMTLAASATAIMQLLAFSFPSAWPWIPRWLADPLPKHAIIVRRLDLAMGRDEGRPVSQADQIGFGDSPTPWRDGLLHDTRAFSSWLDDNVPRDDTLKYIGVVTDWKQDMYAAQLLTWYLPLTRPDIFAVGLSERRYIETYPYQGLPPEAFSWLIHVSHEGRFVPVCDKNGNPILGDAWRSAPGVLESRIRILCGRSLGPLPIEPPVLGLE